MYIRQKINTWLLKPLVWIVPIVILLLFGVRAYNSSLQKQTQESVVNETNRIVGELLTATCGDIPVERCNQAALLKEVKEISERQTLILCTMIRQIADPLDTPDNVRKICKTEIEKFNKEASSNQKPTQPSGNPGNSGANNNSNSKPKNDNNNDNNNEQPNDPVRVLGIPLCVPDPLGLINDGACVR